MKIIIVSIALLWAGVVNAQEVLGSAGVRYPNADLALIEYPQGMNPFIAEAIKQVSGGKFGWATIGDSVSGPFAVSMSNVIRKNYYGRFLNYPSMFNSDFTSITFNGVERGMDSSLPNPNDTKLFKYTPYGGHYILLQDDSLTANTGTGAGFDYFVATFVKTPGSGSVQVTLRDLLVDTVIRTQTINLTNATVDTAAVRFTGLNQNMRFKFIIKGLSDSTIGTLVNFNYSSGITPLQLGRGGSSFTQNAAANPKVVAQLLSEFNIKLLILHAREEGLPGSLSLMANVFNAYPDVGKLVIGEIPNADPLPQIQARTQLYRAFAKSTNSSFVDGTRFFVNQANLIAMGFGGDLGPHPAGGAYDMIMQRIIAQTGLVDINSVYRGNVDNVSDLSQNYGAFGSLYIQTNGGATLNDRKTLVMTTAGGGAPGLVNGLNFNRITFGQGSISDPRTIGPYSTTGIQITGETRSTFYTATLAGGTSTFRRLRIAEMDDHVAAGATTFLMRGGAGNDVRGRLFSAGIAYVRLEAGTATAGQAALKFTSGPLLTTGEAGAWGYDGTNFYVVPSGTTWKRIPIINNATPSNGQIPIGNGTDFTLANIASSGGSVVVTNSAGGINLETNTSAGTFTPGSMTGTNTASITCL
ncbi:MAG: hypothetical protein J7497_12225, partial [Chitinophagaceae bacterium]|nr:hypothetical protein [Chitinophagaceae bacterium]